MAAALSSASVPGRAATAPAQKLVIAVIGDYGACAYDCKNEQPVADLVHSWSPDAIVTVGDNSYDNGTSAEVPADNTPYAADVSAGRFYTTAGNHDWANTCSTTAIDPSTKYFGRPPHYTAHLGGGLVDLFSLDMNCGDPDGDTAGSKQDQIYHADLQASTARWKLTSTHQPMYSSGSYSQGYQAYTHWAIDPSIDLFLSGHDHDWEHLVENGQHYVVDGVGGWSLGGPPSYISGSQFFDVSHFGAVRLTVTPTSLTAEYINSGGALEHSFTINKPQASPTLSTQASGPVPAGGTISDRATLAGGSGPTGTIAYALYGPDSACSGAPAFTSSRTVNGSGSYVSSSFSPAGTGIYRWVATYSGDLNNTSAGPTGCADPAEAVVVGTPTQLFVNRAYLDLLSRPAEPGGLAYWSGLIDGGTPRSDIATAFTTCPECRQAAVNGLYVHYLHRSADSSGLTSTVNFLNRGGTYEQVIAALTGSEEYYALNGGTTDSFVNAVYRDVLNRAPDRPGYDYWVGQMANGSPRSSIATSFSTSREYYELLVIGDYQKYLHRSPDAGGLDFWATAFQQGTRDEAMTANFVGSDEYFDYARNHP